jgi:hypothetical protein
MPRRIRPAVPPPRTPARLTRRPPAIWPTLPPDRRRQALLALSRMIAAQVTPPRPGGEVTDERP